MADFYLDHGAYASALGAAPTWGVPQEGDGSATTAATTSSVGSLLFNAVPTTGNYTLCGVTFASPAGVLNAATVDAAADALAGLINASTTAVGASVAFGQPQLRNLVFARGPTGGAPAGTCQVMMRVGSSTLNHANNSNVAMSHTFDGAPTVAQFTGGSGGCWGWLINPAAIGVSSSIAAGAYGLGVSKPLVWTAALTQNDYVFVRTGSGKSVTLPSTPVNYVRGNVGFPLNLVFDTNTKWADSGTGVFTLTLTGPGGNFLHFRPDNSAVQGNQVVYRCLAKGNLTIVTDLTTASSNVTVQDNASGCFTAYGVKFTDGASLGTNASIKFGMFQQGTFRLVGCELDYSSLVRTNLTYGPHFASGSATAGVIDLDDVDFKVNLSGVPADSVPLFPSLNSANWSNYGMRLSVQNSRFSTNSAYKVKLFTSAVSSTVQSHVDLFFQNNSGLALDSAAIGLQRTSEYQRSPLMARAVFVGDDSTRHQRTECWNGIAEWNPNAATPHPYLAAVQPDGTPYSIRLYWLSTGAMTSYAPFSYCSSLFNRLATGVRTIVQHLFYDTTRGIDGRQLGIAVSYVDSTGKPRTERTHFTQNPVASGAAWTNAGTYPSFGAMKLTVVTTQPVKANTDIKVNVVLISTPPGSGNADVYIDPEFSIT